MAGVMPPSPSWCPWLCNSPRMRGAGQNTVAPVWSVPLTRVVRTPWEARRGHACSHPGRAGPPLGGLL